MQVSGLWWLAGALLALGGATVFYNNHLRMAEAASSSRWSRFTPSSRPTTGFATGN